MCIKTRSLQNPEITLLSCCVPTQGFKGQGSLSRSHPTPADPIRISGATSQSSLALQHAGAPQTFQTPVRATPKLFQALLLQGPGAAAASAHHLQGPQRSPSPCGAAVNRPHPPRPWGLLRGGQETQKDKPSKPAPIPNPSGPEPQAGSGPHNPQGPPAGGLRVRGTRLLCPFHLTGHQP